MTRQLLPLLALAVLCACTPSPPEQVIRQALQRAEAAIEERDAGDAVAVLAEHFDGGGYYGKQDIRRMLALQFLQHQRIEVLLGNVDIELVEPQRQQAIMTATAVATGGVGLLPDDGRIWRLEGRWELIEGDWLLTRLSWK